MKTALVDGDIVAYQAAASANQVHYVTPDGKDYRYKRDAVIHCREAGLSENEIVKVEELDPIEYAFANVKRILNKIMDRTECDTYKVYVSGDSSFRKELSSDYKANRDPSNKPVYLDEVKDYLIQYHDAVVADCDLEADDMLGIDSNNDTVICTLDKDLDQLEGWHYNWTKDHLYYVSSDEGDHWYWVQMLTGDKADNIQGIPGIGDKTAMRLLEDVPSNKRACVVGLEYAKHFDDPEEVYRINAMLLWINR